MHAQSKFVWGKRGVVHDEDENETAPPLSAARPKIIKVFIYIAKVNDQFAEL